MNHPLLSRAAARALARPGSCRACVLHVRRRGHAGGMPFCRRCGDDGLKRREMEHWEEIRKLFLGGPPMHPPMLVPWRRRRFDRPEPNACCLVGDSS